MTVAAVLVAPSNQQVAPARPLLDAARQHARNFFTILFVHEVQAVCANKLFRFVAEDILDCRTTYPFYLSIHLNTNTVCLYRRFHMDIIILQILI